MTVPATRVLTCRDVHTLLDMESCIDAVERAFRLHATNATLEPAVLGTHVPGGGFHVKVAGLLGERPLYAAKVNANFPRNPSENGLPTIQGVLALYDATNGILLALMDSSEITALRTAAASAVAAKYLSRADAHVVTIIGCGVQARPHVRAMHAVRRVDQVFACDVDTARATAFARDVEAMGIATSVVSDYRAAVRASDIVVTCTPARAPLLAAGDLPNGSFLAAVGADHENKQELAPALMAESVVVVDLMEQCAAMGELHHALDADVMSRFDVRGDLAGLVSGRYVGRQSDDEVLIFDSTGTALQDVAAASVAYERACTTGAGVELRFTD
jgi:alanine dehydrogenase